MECPRRLFATIAATILTALIVIPNAEATSITHAFSVTGLDGPLQGVTSAGNFSYDSSSVLPGGGTFSTEVFTALNFTWDGITYNEDTAKFSNSPVGPAGTVNWRPLWEFLY